MDDRWKDCHRAGLTLCRKVDRAIARMGHPDQGAFSALTNALEVQFEQGADPETVRLLLHALLAFTRSAGLSPAALGLADDAEAELARLAPKRRGGATRGRPSNQ